MLRTGMCSPIRRWKFKEALISRSRPRQINDNALAECRNGAVICKLVGYSHIPQKHASAINRFYTEVFNPCLNFHRPCYFAVDKIDAKGKIRKTYPHDQIMTPWERLQSIPNYQTLLNPGVTACHSNNKPMP